MKQEEMEIIYDYLSSIGELNETVLNVLKWIGTDDAVGWFVDAYFVRDYRDMVACLGKENADIIEDYYKLHCQK